MKNDPRQGGDRQIARSVYHHTRVFNLAAWLCACVMTAPGNARGAPCELYPIALSAQAVAGLEPGVELPELLQGTAPGNFGWLTWSGSPAATTLTRSLTPPGDSSTYVNPADVRDHAVSVGDWVRGKPGVSNSKQIRDALDAAQTQDLIVPVWDQVRGTGDTVEYRVAGLARLRLLACQLAGRNQLRARFLGFVDCGIPNAAPVVDAGPDLTIWLGEPARLSGVVRDDSLPAGATLTLTWSQVNGPGTAVFTDPLTPATAVGFDQPGAYVLRLTANDSELVSSDDVTVSVSQPNRAPVAVAADLSATEDQVLDFELGGLDPDGDRLSFTLVTAPGHGLLAGVPPQLRYTPLPDYQGDDRFQFKVSDGQLDSNEAEVRITIAPVNDPPVADTQTVHTSEDEPVDLILTGADVEGSALLFVPLNPPAHGSLVGAPPRLTYLPDRNYHGTDSFSFVAQDSELTSAPATVVILIDAVNDAPHAEPQNVLTLEDTSIGFRLMGEDPEGSTLAYAVLRSPEHGHLSGTAPDLTYTPAPDYHGKDALSFKVDDGELDAEPATVTVTIEPINDPPQVDAGADQLLNLPVLSATLDGSVSDDDFTGALSVTWRQLSGSGLAQFDDASAPRTRVQFSEPGVYVLELAADDSQLLTRDQLTVLVNQPPSVELGDDRTVGWNDSTRLTASVMDDGLPPDHPLQLHWVVASGPGVAYLSELEGTTARLTFDTPGTYVVRCVVDDSQLTGRDELTITVLPPNQPPRVQAGPDRLIAWGDRLLLEGSATDDGLPADRELVYHWSQVGGPARALFTDAAALTTAVAFEAPGVYILRLSASDGELAAVDDRLVTVNQAPVVTVGPDLVTTVSNRLTLPGVASDDGLPTGQLHSAWSRVSGPGPAFFADPSHSTTAVTLTTPGEYLLRLTVTDGHLEGSAHLFVAVRPAGANVAPIVSAGPDRYVALTNRIALQGAVADDGLPFGVAVKTAWRQLSGPGEVQFADPQATNSLATFTTPGVYVLRLECDDTEFSVGDDLTVAIYPANQPPSVDAGQAQTLATGPALLAGLVSDDGLPANGPLTLTWSQINGPGTVFFDRTDTAFARATFSAPGIYVLRLTASDSEFSGSDDVTVTVTGNQAPVVAAGADQVIELFVPEGDPGPSLTVYPVLADAWHYAVGQPGLSGSWVRPNCLATSGTDLYIAGAFGYAGGVEVRSLARWDGCHYRALYDPRPIDSEDPSSAPIGFIAQSGTTEPVAARGAEVFVAGGFLRDLDQDGSLDFTARWSGSGWEPWQFHIVSSSVAARAMLTTPEAVYFAGRFKFQTSNVPGAPVSFNIARWNGAHWEQLGDGVKDIRDTSDRGTIQYATVNTLALAPNGDLYAGGRFVLGTPTGLATNVARWNGTAWSPFGPGALSGCQGSGCITEVHALTFDAEGQLYVGGDFTQAGGAPAMFIARWDGAQWRPVGGGFNGIVYALAWHRDELYAAGSFSQAEGRVVNRLARWDGARWLGLNGGLGFRAFALAASPSGLYVGGQFTSAGGQPSNLIAKWGHDTLPVLDGPEPLTIEQAPANGTAVPVTVQVGHPCGDGLALAWSVDGGPIEQRDQLEPSAAGHPIPVTFSRVYTPGTHALTLRVDDGLHDPVVFSTTVTVLAPAVATLSGFVSDDGLPHDGRLVASWQQLDGPAPVHFGDPAAPATEARFTRAGSYRLELSGHDGERTAGDDLQIAVRAIGNVNLPPSAHAGRDQAVPLAETITLSGLALDDGSPEAHLTLAWTQIAGPVPVALTTAAETVVPSGSSLLATGLTAFATLEIPGDYQFRFSANDGEFARFDDVTVHVRDEANQPPTVQAGPSQTVSVAEPAGIVGLAQDDGLPDGTLVSAWTQLAGPTTAALQVENIALLASFSEPGDYVFRYTASDGRLEGHADVRVTVLAETPSPLVTLAAPADGAVITEPSVLRGTVASAALQSWQVECRPVPADEPGGAAPAWVSLLAGTAPVSAGELGIWDPTLWLNGPYELRLSARDRTGRTAATEPVTVLVDGRFKPGHFRLTFTDLAVPLAGLPIEIRRTYDSRAARAGQGGEFGLGWTLDLRSVQLRKHRSLSRDWQQVYQGGWYVLEPVRPREISIVFPDERAARFVAALSPDVQFGYPIATVNLQFANRPGTYGRLEVDGSALTSVDGFTGPVDLVDLATFGDFEPTRFRYTTPEGTVYVIDSTAGLQSVSDRSGNRLTVTPEGIRHSSGVAVRFVRDAEGRLREIIDPAGQTLRYAYNAGGDLVSFTDRAGQSTAFAYQQLAFPHHLTAILGPQGTAALRVDYDATGRMIRQADPHGQAVEFQHDLAARRETVCDRLGHATVYEHDARGNLTRRTDPLGAVTSFTYDALDNLLTWTDPLGQTTHYLYDTVGNLVSMTRPGGHTVGYTFNPFRQLLSATDARGQVIRFDYDGSGRLTRATDPLGHVTRFAHNPQGLVTAITNPLGQVTRFAYDPQGRLQSETRPDGLLLEFGHDDQGQVRWARTASSADADILIHEVGFGYDAAGRVTKVTLPDGSQASQAFDLQGRVVRQLDPLGRLTYFEYDAAGYRTRLHFADGSTEGRAYDPEGRLIAVTNPLGQVTQYPRDALGRVTQVIHPDGSGAAYRYDQAGRLVAVTDPRGSTTGFGYDAEGRLVAVTNALGEVIQHEYDANDNRTATIDPLGHRTDYQYDALNRLTTVRYADGAEEHWQYDALGRCVIHLDAAGRSTQFDYSALSRLVAVTNALGHVARYTYDALGRLVEQTDPLGRSTRFAYDALGRRTARTLPDGQSERFAYHAAGALAARTDFNGYTTTYSYDAAGRLTRKQPDPRFGIAPITFDYDARGQCVLRSDPTGQTHYRYDARGRLLERTVDWAIAPVTSTLTYAYDGAGNVTRLRSAHPNGTDTAYDYDALNRLISVRDDSGIQAANGGSPWRTAYGYDAAGNLAWLSQPNGLVTWYHHDRRHRLTNVLIFRGQDLEIAGFRYTLDPTGRRWSVAESFRDLSGYPGARHHFAYDPLYQVTAESRELSGAHAELRYSYDAVGNRLSRQVNGSWGPLTSTTFAYDRNDQIIGWVYDTNGNPLESATPGAGSVKDTYDFEDRLIRREANTAGGSMTVTFAYDGGGHRVARSTGGGLRLLLVDELNPTGRAQVVEEVALENGQAVVIRAYTYGHTLLHQDQVVTGSGGAPEWQRSYVGHDARGSVRFLTDAGGNLTDLLDYDAFGNVIRRAGTTPLQHGWGAEYWDPELGLYHLRARDYDPAVGRFRTRDTFAGVLSDPASLHGYLFALNDPVNRVDPSGHFSALSMSLGVTYGLSLRNIYDGVALQVGYGLIHSLEGLREGRSDEQVVLDYLLATLRDAGLGFGVAYGAKALLPALVRVASQPLASAANTGAKLSSALRSWRNGTILTARELLRDVGRQQLLTAPKTTQLEFGFVQQLERQVLARQFYKSVGWADARINAHLKGIDFDSAVDIATLPKGSELVQYGFPGEAVGNYFALPGTLPATLGIYPHGRETSYFTALEDLIVLRSTAASTVDSWSVPGWNIDVSGGAIQYFLADTSLVLRKP